MVACLLRKVQIIPAKNWGNALYFASHNGLSSDLADCTNEVFCNEFLGGNARSNISCYLPFCGVNFGERHPTFISARFCLFVISEYYLINERIVSSIIPTVEQNARKLLIFCVLNSVFCGHFG